MLSVNFGIWRMGSVLHIPFCSHTGDISAALIGVFS